MIAHLDCDAFYATVELNRRPELKGRPVIVAGSGPRAVVTTASYEARKFGVGSAMPASKARRLCPDAVVIPPDFEAYRDTSKAVWEAVCGRLDRVQRVGLDEAYAELTGVPKPLRVLRANAKGIYKHTFVFAEISAMDAGMYYNQMLALSSQTIISAGLPVQNYLGPTLIVGAERLPLISAGLSITF